jgi:hypothetical protein
LIAESSTLDLASAENLIVPPLQVMKHVFKPIRGISAAAICALAFTALLQAETEIIDGFNASIVEIASPDDLHLDPDTVIIAVDSWGDEDREVNGVLFQEDRSTGGTVERDGVEVTTNQANMIDNWAAFPTFTGGDGDSAENLGSIMQDIRWNGAPNPVTVEVTGLPPNTLIEVQMLTNEGADRNRRWDIGVGDLDDPDLVIDDYTSEGHSDEGIWTPENSFAAKFEAETSDDGELVIVMRQHIGGQDPPGGDNNPILQAVILHSLTPPGVDSIWGDATDDLGDATPDGWDLTVVETNGIEAEGDGEGLTQFFPSAWTYYASDQRDVETFVVTPLLIKNEDGVFTVEAIGDPHTPEDPGVQENLPFKADATGETYDISGDVTYHIGFIGQQPEGSNDANGGIIPFEGDGGPGMFAMNTLPDTVFELGDEIINGHASGEGGRNYQYNFTLTWPTGDIDGDGCSDSYEEKNGMNKSDPADVLLDPDNDGLTSLQECTKDKGDPVFPFVTKANVADTDGDGLNDGVETGTGTWVGPEDTGTDPLKADTDKDKLLDGVETNTGTFVDAANTGTDPFNKDTDGDDGKDGLEVSCNTNPLDANDRCSAIKAVGDFKITHVWPDGDPQMNDVGGVNDFFEDIGDVEAVELKYPLIHFHDNANAPIFQDESIPYPLWSDEFGDGSGPADRNDFAILVEGQIWILNAGVATFICNSDDGFELSIDGDVVGEVGNRGRGNTVMEVDLTEGPHDFRFIHWERGGGAGVSVYIYRGTGDAPGLNAGDYELLRAFEDLNDEDEDGIGDEYEVACGLDPEDPSDAVLDKDGDGLSNLEEFELGTGCNDADSDDDGLSDKVETGTGTWVSAENTGTKPLRKDSDGDSLPDGVENNSGTFVSRDNPGTDPNKKDTDGDDWDDTAEIDLGSNPVDSNSSPGDVDGTVVITGEIVEILGPDDLHLDPSTVVIAIDSFGDEDREVNGVLFQTDKTDNNSVGEAESNGVVFKSRANNFIDGWATPPAFTGGQGDSADNLAAIMEDIRWNGAPAPVTVDVEGLNPSATYEIQLLVNEGADRNRRWDIAVEGRLVVDDFTSEGDSNEGVWSPENSFAYIGEFKPSADGILNVVMRQHFGGQPSPGGDNNPILQGVIVHRAGSGRIFQITDIGKSPAELTLTWNSLPGKEYAVEWIQDLSSTVWTELDDGVASEGESTSFTDDDAGRVGASDGYYRVREN